MKNADDVSDRTLNEAWFNKRRALIKVGKLHYSRPTQLAIKIEDHPIPFQLKVATPLAHIAMFFANDWKLYRVIGWLSLRFSF